MKNTTEALRVLLVDDDAFSRTVCEAMLRKLGVVFESSDSSQKALQLLESSCFEKKPFYVVLMDFRMPDIDGFEATRRIRAHHDESIRNVCIVGLSGNKSFEDQSRAMEAGMNRCLSKPVSISDLKNAFLDEFASPDAAHAPPSGDFNPLVLDALSQATSREVVRSIIQSFLKNLPMYTDQILQGMAQKNWEQVHRYSHILKASAATVGAVKMSFLSERMEEASQGKLNSKVLQELVEETKNDTRKLIEVLMSYLEKL